MALSSAGAIIGRHVLHRNATIILENCARNAKYLTSKYSTVKKTSNEEVAYVFDDYSNQPVKKMSKAMKAYLQRSKEYNEFMENEKAEYQIGKRHLANMMGQDPDTFTQDDVKKSIEYLFPSGLFESRARPIMEEPTKLFAEKKEAQFDSTGRPYHSMFYTTKPNYFEALYNIIEHIIKLNKMEDDEISKGFLPQPKNKMDIIPSRWLTITELQKIFFEKITEIDYEAFVKAGDRLISHPYSESAKDFIMKYRKQKEVQTKKLFIEPVLNDDQGRPFVSIKNCKKKSAEGEVKLLGNGSGKITINGRNITYFERQQHREQVIFPLIFTDMTDKIDVEATVKSGGPSGQAGAIRWGIAWGLRSFVDENMIEKMRIAGLLTKDRRRRERKKPGQEGARRKFTWKKR